MQDENTAPDRAEEKRVDVPQNAAPVESTENSGQDAAPTQSDVPATPVAESTQAAGTTEPSATPDTVTSEEGPRQDAPVTEPVTTSAEQAEQAKDASGSNS